MIDGQSGAAVSSRAFDIWMVTATYTWRSRGACEVLRDHVGVLHTNTCTAIRLRRVPPCWFPGRVASCSLTSR